MDVYIFVFIILFSWEMVGSFGDLFDVFGRLGWSYVDCCKWREGNCIS